jgi:predicted transcriptional regulator
MIGSKENFIKFFNLLMEQEDLKELAQNNGVDLVDAKNYFDNNVVTAVKTATSKSTGLVTENGKKVLSAMNRVLFPVNAEPHDSATAAIIAEDLFISQKSLAGIMRKLITDEYVEKVGSEPITYALTEKGKDYLKEL